MQRQFTSGSRQAPDPFDQFLEENNFYRKHTARDATCLFRVISEQMYDTQLHHLEIRKKCVNYMRNHKQIFQPLIDRDLDEYLDDMSKPKTYGTLLELHAAGYLYQRNILLFEPFNLGNYYFQRPYYTEVFRVFYTPERHFDSVFTSDYIKDAAICQAICYEILYKDLFKLPDVSYAVEYMLHSNSFDSNEYNTESDGNGYSRSIYFPDGRGFDLDLPQNTSCILENYKMCHFHYVNFPSFADDIKQELNDLSSFTNVDENEEMEKTTLKKTVESLLPHKYISCVRQLLNEGITPFPYKVAKALDPNMYRNIEFDSWNEARKEIKLQNWYNGDTNFKVGAKCHVQLCNSENDLLTCHIQEIAGDKGYCIVFVEQLGEKHVVPYESLTPLPPEQFKPWSLPYRLQRHLQKYSAVRFTRQYNYRLKFKEQFASSAQYGDNIPPIKRNDISIDEITDSPKHNYINETAQKRAANCYYKLKQFTHLENFRTHTVEYCTMPLTVSEIDTKGGNTRQQNDSVGNDTTNSRTPSRETVMTVATPIAAAATTTSAAIGAGDSADQCELDNGNVGYTEATVPYNSDYSGYYTMTPYIPVASDDYYGYDGAIPTQATVIPTTTGGMTYYYMCNPPLGNYVQGSNVNLAAGAHLQPQAHCITPGSYPPPHSSLPLANGYYASPYYAPLPNGIHTTQQLVSSYQPTSVTGGANVASVINTQNATNTYNGSQMTRGRNVSISVIPINGQIKLDAKKSTQMNGSDLPNDTATLRYFYNLGVEYYQKHSHHAQRRNNNNTNDNNNQTSSNGSHNGSGEGPNTDRTPIDGSVTSVTQEFQVCKIDDTTIIEPSTSDSNNNNVITTQTTTTTTTSSSSITTTTTINTSAHNQYHTNSGNGKVFTNRRYYSRYNSNNNHPNFNGTHPIQNHKEYRGPNPYRNHNMHNHNSYGNHSYSNSGATSSSGRNDYSKNNLSSTTKSGGGGNGGVNASVNVNSTQSTTITTTTTTTVGNTIRASGNIQIQYPARAIQTTSPGKVNVSGRDNSIPLIPTQTVNGGTSAESHEVPMPAINYPNVYNINPSGDHNQQLPHNGTTVYTPFNTIIPFNPYEYNNGDSNNNMPQMGMMYPQIQPNTNGTQHVNGGNQTNGTNVYMTMPYGGHAPYGIFGHPPMQGPPPPPNVGLQSQNSYTYMNGPPQIHHIANNIQGPPPSVPPMTTGYYGCDENGNKTDVPQPPYPCMSYPPPHPPPISYYSNVANTAVPTTTTNNNNNSGTTGSNSNNSNSTNNNATTNTQSQAMTTTTSKSTHED